MVTKYKNSLRVLPSMQAARQCAAGIPEGAHMLCLIGIDEYAELIPKEMQLFKAIPFGLTRISPGDYSALRHAHKSPPPPIRISRDLLLQFKKTAARIYEAELQIGHLGCGLIPPKFQINLQALGQFQWMYNVGLLGGFAWAFSDGRLVSDFFVRHPMYSQFIEGLIAQYG